MAEENTNFIKIDKDAPTGTWEITNASVDRDEFKEKIGEIKDSIYTEMVRQNDVNREFRGDITAIAKIQLEAIDKHNGFVDDTAVELTKLGDLHNTHVKQFDNFTEDTRGRLNGIDDRIGLIADVLHSHEIIFNSIQETIKSQDRITEILLKRTSDLEKAENWTKWTFFAMAIVIVLMYFFFAN